LNTEKYKKLSYRRETASAAHAYLGWLTDRAMQVISETYEDLKKLIS